MSYWNLKRLFYLKSMRADTRTQTHLRKPSYALHLYNVGFSDYSESKCLQRFGVNMFSKYCDCSFHLKLIDFLCIVMGLKQLINID